MSGRFSIEIDAGSCVGHGRCFDLHPQLFGADDEGFPLVTADQFDPEQRGEAQDAVYDCPERAIRLTDRTDVPSSQHPG